MTEDMTTDPFLVAMQTLADQVRMLSETAAGYRAELERAGWSPTAAEGVAAHALMLWQVVAFTPKCSHGGAS